MIVTWGNHGPGNTVSVCCLTRWPLTPILYTSGVFPPTSKNKCCTTHSDRDTLVDLLRTHPTLPYPTWLPVAKYTQMLTRMHAHRAHIATIVARLSFDNSMSSLVVLMNLNNALLEWPKLCIRGLSSLHLSLSLSRALTYTHTHTCCPPPNHLLFCRNSLIWPVILQHNVQQVQLGMMVSSQTLNMSRCTKVVLSVLQMDIFLFVSVFHWQATIMGPVSMTSSPPIETVKNIKA